jgi:hypothetical protein
MNAPGLGIFLTHTVISLQVRTPAHCCCAMPGCGTARRAARHGQHADKTSGVLHASWKTAMSCLFQAPFAYNYPS